MESDIIPLQSAMKLRDLYFDGAFDEILKDKKWRELPPYIGLISINEEQYWSSEDRGESYLKVIDKEKYLWAKLKYGI